MSARAAGPGVPCAPTTIRRRDDSIRSAAAFSKNQLAAIAQAAVVFLREYVVEGGSGRIIRRKNQLAAALFLELAANLGSRHLCHCSLAKHIFSRLAHEPACGVCAYHSSFRHRLWRISHSLNVVSTITASYLPSASDCRHRFHVFRNL